MPGLSRCIDRDMGRESPAHKKDPERGARVAQFLEGKLLLDSNPAKPSGLKAGTKM